MKNDINELRNWETSGSVLASSIRTPDNGERGFELNEYHPTGNSFHIKSTVIVNDDAPYIKLIPLMGPWPKLARQIMEYAKFYLHMDENDEYCLFADSFQKGHKISALGINKYWLLDTWRIDYLYNQTTHNYKSTLTWRMSAAVADAIDSSLEESSTSGGKSDRMGDVGPMGDAGLMGSGPAGPTGIPPVVTGYRW